MKTKKNYLLSKEKRKKMKEKRRTIKKKYKGNKYPFRNVTKEEALHDFFSLKKKENLNPRSLFGNKLVNYGTEKARVKTKYRGHSSIDKWKDLKKRKKLKKVAKKLLDGSYQGARNLFESYQYAIDLHWGTINSMRPAAALNFYRKHKATCVLDFTAGWGSRMTAALAGNFDYIGIDSNKNLKPGYNKILSLVKKHSKSKVKLFFKPAEKVDFSKLKYDMVFTSPPYEYLEVYENMKNYEGTGNINQPSSSSTIKDSDGKGFYDDFLIPTIKEAYKYLPKGKLFCLNIPDLMYKKIRKKWKKADKTENYMIIKRPGSNLIPNQRRGKENVYCWIK
jgi:hypothetical protein